MLTRLEVDGFKNLRNIDVYFGPFTCVAGFNAAGKSNLFDAINFLALLADRPFGEAAELVRGTENERTSDPRDLFWNGWNEPHPVMRLAAEMIVPNLVEDDLGQEARPSITFLRYEIQLEYEAASNGARSGRIALRSERLSHITQGDSAAHLPFKHDPKKFRKEVIFGRRSGAEFISTDGTTVQVHQDGGSRGKPLPASKSRASTSVLSTIRTADSPTILAARREMQQWRRVSLEPSAMRSADRFSDSSVVGSDGRHIPSALFRLAEKAKNPEEVYAKVASRLNDLAGLGVTRLWVEQDEVRELLTLRVEERSGATVPARSLSEGTLRFLALCTMLEDDSISGVICMEEPENGLHPENVPAMIRLLKDIAVDPNQTPDSNNPFRQVIVNTHAPMVVDLVSADELLIARGSTSDEGTSTNFYSLRDTWRARANPSCVIGRAALAPYATPPKGQLRFDFPEAS
jgi:predicted ATPase